MVSIPMEVYLDFSLRKKVHSIVLNVNELKSQMSNLDVFFISNKFKADNNGNIVSKKITTNFTFFVKFIDETNNINFKMLKAAFFGNVFESDFETMSFAPTDPENYANYYEGHEVPYEEGDWLYYAYVPFGKNIIELLNGDKIETCGTYGKVWITKEQKGFKRYAQVPKVNELFAMGPYKILKLAVYSIYEERGPQSYSFHLFAPDMKEEVDDSYEMMPLSETYSYTTFELKSAKNGLDIVDYKNPDTPIRVNGILSTGNPIEGLDTKLVLKGNSGFLDYSNVFENIKDEFTIHVGLNIYKLSPRGTIIFEGAYGIDDNGNQTHHMTIWLNKNGELCYNAKYNDEYINTKFVFPLNVYTNLTFVMANVQMNPELEEEKEYMGFLFVNGRQVWPKETYLNPDEQLVLTRGYKAFRTYNDVCLKLEMNSATSSYLDVKGVCVKKLLRESGFVTIDNLNQVYTLWNKRPKPTSVDIGAEFIIGNSDKTTIKKAYFGQDSYEDIMDREYYFEGEFYEITIFNRALTRKEISELNLINSLGFYSVDRNIDAK